MELKANECRYGNFIIGTYESEDDNLVHETICEFKFYDCYNNHYNVESKERIEEFTGLKPIPLTEEWKNKIFTWLGSGYKIEWRNNRINIYLDNNYIATCDYLHEYQNLHFAITNKELEIKM